MINLLLMLSLIKAHILVRHWAIHLGIATIISSAVLSVVTWLAINPITRQAILTIPYILPVGMVLLLVFRCLWYWVALFSGKVIFVETKTIILSNGHVIVPELCHEYELWLYTANGFVQHCGFINITTGSGEILTKQFPRRIPGIQSLKPNKTPIIWQISVPSSIRLNSVRLDFQLVPAFPKPLLPKEASHVCDTETVTIVIKSRKRGQQRS